MRKVQILAISITVIGMLTAGVALAADKPSADKGFNPKLIRGDELIGFTVQNPGGEKLGKVEEVVLDPGENRVSYVVLSFGGFLGMGDKYFAVPWSAFTMRHDDKALVLDVTTDRLKAAPGFDKRHWPDFADQNWVRDINEFYGVRAEASKGGETPAKTGAQDMKSEHFWARKLSKVIGLDIRNRKGEDLGSVEDVLIDLREGRVVFGVVGYGSVLGIGGKMVIVPWSAFELRPQLDALVLDCDRQTLDNVAFTGRYPDLSDLAYTRRLYDTFSQKPYWEVYGYVSGEEPVRASRMDEIWAADSAYNKLFDRGHIVTISGAIESVGTFQPAENAAGGLRLRVTTDKGEVFTVHAGPTIFVEGKGFRFYYGDQVTVTGSDVKWNGRSILMATEIQIGGKTLQLRDKDGKPVWKVEDLQRHGGTMMKTEVKEKG